MTTGNESSSKSLVNIIKCESIVISCLLLLLLPIDDDDYDSDDNNNDGVV